MLKLPKEMTENLAEFVGIMLGDGCIGVYKCRNLNNIKIQHRVKITLNSEDDLEYSAYISNLINELFGIKPLIRKRKNEKTVDLLLFNKELLTYLTEKVGLKKSPKIGNARIPFWAMDKKFQRHVLRGYFDTDGCLALVKNGTNQKYPRIEIKISKSPMQKQFLDILNKTEIKFGCYNCEKEMIKFQINGLKKTNSWMQLVGSKNQKHVKKFESIKQETF